MLYSTNEISIMQHSLINYTQLASAVKPDQMQFMTEVAKWCHV